MKIFKYSTLLFIFLMSITTFAGEKGGNTSDILANWLQHYSETKSCESNGNIGISLESLEIACQEIRIDAISCDSGWSGFRCDLSDLEIEFNQDCCSGTVGNTPL